jgi:hypothetical protein
VKRCVIILGAQKQIVFKRDRGYHSSYSRIRKR